MDDARADALGASLAFHKIVGDLPLIGDGEDREAAVLDTADTFLVWLRGAVTIRLQPGPVLDQSTGQPSGTPSSTGGAMQIHDNEQFDLTVDTKDAKGFETPDAVTWSVDDESVVTLVISDDTRTATVVAGNPGSAVVTVSDGALLVTEAVDVVPAGTATIALVEGPVSVQP